MGGGVGGGWGGGGRKGVKKNAILFDCLVCITANAILQLQFMSLVGLCQQNY